jgi:hypothetical protein
MEKLKSWLYFSVARFARLGRKTVIAFESRKEQDTSG